MLESPAPAPVSLPPSELEVESSLGVTGLVLPSVSSPPVEPDEDSVEPPSDGTVGVLESPAPAPVSLLPSELEVESSLGVTGVELPSVTSPPVEPDEDSGEPPSDGTVGVLESPALVSVSLLPSELELESSVGVTGVELPSVTSPPVESEVDSVESPSDGTVDVPESTVSGPVSLLPSVLELFWVTDGRVCPLLAVAGVVLEGLAPSPLDTTLPWASA